MYLFRQELKLNLKSFIIWALSIGGLLYAVILIFDSMGESADELSDMFSNMGAFTSAFGMERVSIGTLPGYFAVEGSVIASLGTAMYAALTGAGIVAKEEETHTGEFLSTLPLGRARVLTGKFAAVLALTFFMQLVCAVCSVLGFLSMGELDGNVGYIMGFHARTLLMNAELASVSFMLSAMMKKRPTGAALGMVLMCYFVDIIGKVVDSLDKLRLALPFALCDAADVLTKEAIPTESMITACAVTAASLIAAYTVYTKRDLAS